MRILIISDTHGSFSNFYKVIEREKKIGMLLHLGDVGGDAGGMKAVLDCPVYMVAGNNDFFSDLPKERELDIGTHRVFLTHGHNYYVSMGTKRLKQAAKARGADIVMYGHTHCPLIDRDGSVTAINPGSLAYPRQPGRKATYIIMDTDAKGEDVFTLKYV